MGTRVIRNFYLNMSKPAKASFWFVFCNVLTKGISFLSLPIFTRLMTTEQYGELSIYHSWVSVFSIFTTLTLWGGVLNVAMVKFSEKKDTLISSFQGLSTTITICFAVLSCFFITFICRLLKMNKTFVLLMYLDLLSQIPFNLWSTRQKYEYKYKHVVLVSLIIAVLNPLVGYILVKNSSYKVEARIISGLFVSCSIGFVIFFLNYKRGGKLFVKEFWKYAFQFSVVLIPYYLSLQVLNQADRIMISRLCGESDAGIYSVAYTFAMLLNLVTNGIVASLTPYIYQSMKDNQSENLRKRTTAIVAFVGIISLLVICIVPDLFKFILPKSYYPALRVIPPVTLGAFFMFVYPLFSTVEMYYEEKQYITTGAVIAALINVILNYYFIKLFGFIAAAYTTLICYIVLSIVHYVFMRRVQKKHNSSIEVYSMKPLLFICFFVTCFGLLMMIIYDYNILRWSIITSILILCYVKKNWILNIINELSIKKV